MDTWDEHVRKVMDEQQRLTGHRWVEYQGEGPPTSIAELVFGHNLTCKQDTDCVDLYKCAACGAMDSGSPAMPDVWLEGEAEMMRPCPARFPDWTPPQESVGEERRA
jgi:hypothetical protein